MNCGYETWLRKQTLDLRSEQRRVNLPETARGWTCSPSQRAYGTPTGSRGPGTHEARALPWQNNAHVALGVGTPHFSSTSRAGPDSPHAPQNAAPGTGTASQEPARRCSKTPESRPLGEGSAAARSSTQRGPRHAFLSVQRTAKGTPRQVTRTCLWRGSWRAVLGMSHGGLGR